ncbi:hypothetical protein [Archangium violaceum]|uniref:Uncharacterized protein n=1 Tax=Archangium violaceum Cb vi76 TaxID=1406225 RepID=A0A084SKJ9_9BACT|nr:hypothetical protein [Archangium violaceum]KFA88984.1 hypothetical protein Q664_38050 [Archangium violaceum Cb vi76]
MDSISGVAEAPATARKHGSLVGLAPLFGLLAGGAASWLAISVYQSPLYFLDWHVWETGVISGASTLGALVAAWGVRAKSQGRNVPVAVLILAACAGWLVALPLALRDALRMREALAYASDPRPLFGSGFSDSATLRLLGVLLSAGVLLGAALGLASATARMGRSNWSGRSLGRGLLLTSPVLALPLVTLATMSGSTRLASFMGILSLLAFSFLGTGALAAPTVAPEEPRALPLATGALWTGACGVVTGCVGLRAMAYAAACTAMSNVDPEYLLLLVNENTHELDTMAKVTGVALLACVIPPVIFAVLSVRRGARGMGLVAGALGALLLASSLWMVDGLTAKSLDDQYQEVSPHPFNTHEKK